MPLESQQQDAVEGFQLVIATLERVLGQSPNIRALNTMGLGWDWIALPTDSTSIVDITGLFNTALDAKLGTDVSRALQFAH
jgi:hypothetical protein